MMKSTISSTSLVRSPVKFYLFIYPFIDCCIHCNSDIQNIPPTCCAVFCMLYSVA